MRKSEYKKLSQQAEERSNIYGFLSLVYGREPTAEFLERIRAEDLASTLRELGVVFDDIFDIEDQERLLEELAVEYTRLYVGPGHHIPPFESVHVDAQEAGGKKVPGLMGGRATQAAAQELKRHGYELTRNFKDMPDHIATELALMHFLAQAEKEAWERREKEGALGLLASQHRFLKEHLANWAPEFCDKARDYAKLKFYQTLAALTKEFLLSEKEAFPVLMKKAEEV